MCFERFSFLCREPQEVTVEPTGSFGTESTKGRGDPPWWPSNVETNLIMRVMTCFPSRQGKNDKQFKLRTRKKYSVAEGIIQVFI